jgi:hypothetical protein
LSPDRRSPAKYGRADGPARFVPHGAFDLPGTPADAPPRESIEVRTLVVVES